jgi:hypothetical protein
MVARAAAYYSTMARLEMRAMLSAAVSKARAVGMIRQSSLGSLSEEGTDLGGTGVIRTVFACYRAGGL